MNRKQKRALESAVTGRSAVTQPSVCFSELANDLFGVVLFSWHGSDLLIWLFTTLDLDQECGVRSMFPFIVQTRN